MHFVSAESASRQAGITQTQLKELADAGIISGVEKNGCTFYSPRDVYRMKAIRFLMRTRGLTLDQARLEVDTSTAETAP